MQSANATPMRGSGGRVATLDGLRALAFGAVFLHHALGLPLLWMGVDLFFVISGFLITSILLRTKDAYAAGPYLRLFYYRRLLRIVPPYYLVLTAVFVFAAHDVTGNWRWYALFASNVGDGLFGHAGGSLDPMWSLAVEEQFYLLWPLVVLLTTRRTLPYVIGFMIVSAPATRALLTVIQPSYEAVYRLTPARWDLLAVGALIGLQAEAIQRRPRLAARIAVAALAAASTLFVVLAVRYPSFRTSAHSLLFNVTGYSLGVVAFGGVVLWAVAGREGIVARLLRSRPLTYLGEISYVLYLVHHAVLRQLASWIDSRLLVAMVGFGVTVVLGAASWRWFERPLLKLKARYQPRSRIKPAADSSRVGGPATALQGGG